METANPHDSNHGELARAMRDFGLIGDLSTLPGGTRQTYRVGSTVLKHIHDTSLENNHSRDLVQWIAGLFGGLHESGFRIPRPRHTREGAWITEEGWTAWSALEGRHPRVEGIPSCIDAIVAFH